MEDRTVQAPVHTHLEGRRDPTMKEVCLFAAWYILSYTLYLYIYIYDDDEAGYYITLDKIV